MPVTVRLCQDHRWGRDLADGQELRLLHQLCILMELFPASNHNQPKQHHKHSFPHRWLSQPHWLEFELDSSGARSVITNHPNHFCQICAQKVFEITQSARKCLNNPNTSYIPKCPKFPWLSRNAQHSPGLQECPKVWFLWRNLTWKTLQKEE